MNSESQLPEGVHTLCAACAGPVELDEPLWIERPDGSLFSCTLAELDDRWRTIRGRVWHVACVAGKLRHVPGRGRDAALTGRVHDALYELNNCLAVVGGYASMVEAQLAALPAKDQRVAEIAADVTHMRHELRRAIAASRRVSRALQPPS